ncbi:MAG: GyrI-like domain-containing protein [Bacteroidetes bacterium]|nr:GyrI-like domain-containing protein [Bacteroidota bacterium]
MSYADYRIGELWGSFMPRRKEIRNNLTSDLKSLVVYPISHFVDFKPTNEFERWATIEVENFDEVPTEMETYISPSGLYAVFTYKGTSSGASDFFRYIYGEWVPNSNYILDDRAHFEVLGEKYKNNDPSSEEEIWIPIKAK